MPPVIAANMGRFPEDEVDQPLFPGAVFFASVSAENYCDGLFAPGATLWEKTIENQHHRGGRSGVPHRPEAF